MSVSSEPLAQVVFAGEVIVWRGPAPHLFVALPDAAAGVVRAAAWEASYGWGVVPVVAQIDGTEFATSLFPRSGGYLLPLKLAVRQVLGIAAGDRVAVTLSVMARAGR